VPRRWVRSDRYGQHIIKEVLPHAEQIVKLRADAYSRGAAGASSGGISAFKLAWFQPQKFSRVHSTIGSFTGLQWDRDKHLDGGFIFSSLVLRQARRNIRVWMSDGTNDYEIDHEGRRDLFRAGSWPLNNIQLANALKFSGYDFHFRFREGHHNVAQAALDLPESLAWLWRDYDPERTEQTFEQDPSERDQPRGVQIFDLYAAGASSYSWITPPRRSWRCTTRVWVGGSPRAIGASIQSGACRLRERCGRWLLWWRT
jgi:S-formylglutathione hydrolase FrmB